jgi:hypothetical protein
MSKAQTFSFLIIICVSQNLIAAEEQPSAFKWDDFRSEVTGRVEMQYTGHNRDSIHEPENHFLETRVQATWSKPLSDRWYLEITPEIYLDEDSKGNDTWRADDKGLQRSAGGLSSATLSYFGDTTEFVIGKQTISWGKGDLYSPTDNVNPTDALVVPDSYKLGVTAISARHTGEKWSTHAVLIPAFTPNRVPQPDNRWTRGTEALQSAATAKLGFAPILNIGERILPDQNTDNMQFGLQFTSSTLKEGWDFEVSYFRGNQADGVFEQRLDGAVLNLPRLYPKYQELGLGFSTTVNETEFHGEAAWHVTTDEDLDEDYVTYLLGMRRSFYDTPLSNKIEEISVSLEYAVEDITRERPEGSQVISTGLGRALTNSVLSNVTFKFSEETSIEANAFVNLDEGDYSVQLKGVHQTRDSIEISASLESFGGPEETFFGEWADNDRIVLGITYFL